ncbi:MAG: sulfite exporter TauE/SafE family protein [SAR324 cluster bacterium]|nr:sulfite exporter TauE/SafE family protein [SAR324 cluster bacterium]
MFSEWELLTGLSSAELLYAVIAIGGAAFIRGYSGFGFSALTVTSLTLILPPAEVVPTAFLLEIAASIHMLPLVWKKIDWKVLSWLILGAILGTPFGIFFLEQVPPDQLRILISCLVLAACILLLKNFRISKTAGRGLTTGVGCFSGLVNGVAAIGGLPVVLFLLSTSSGAALSRASLVAYFFFTDIYAVLLSGNQQLISAPLLWRTGLLILPLIIGIYLGHRRFVSSTPESFRKFALSLLIVLSLAGLVRGLLL